MDADGQPKQRLPSQISHMAMSRNFSFVLNTAFHASSSASFSLNVFLSEISNSPWLIEQMPPVALSISCDEFHILVILSSFRFYLNPPLYFPAMLRMTI